MVPDREVVTRTADVRAAVAETVVVGHAEAAGPSAPDATAVSPAVSPATASSGAVSGPGSSGGWPGTVSSSGAPSPASTASTASAPSAAATVTATVSGTGDLHTVTISPAAHALPARDLSQLIQSAIQDARRTAAERWRADLEAALGAPIPSAAPLLPQDES